jgi:hypothetical protein
LAMVELGMEMIWIGMMERRERGGMGAMEK